ncbi:MAG: GH25 family lysozyme [Nostocoides sp.]
MHHITRRGQGAIAALAMALTSLTAYAARADEPRVPDPTARAAQSGITRAGGAVMGWSLRTSSGGQAANDAPLSASPADVDARAALDPDAVAAAGLGTTIPQATPSPAPMQTLAPDAAVSAPAWFVPGIDVSAYSTSIQLSAYAQAGYRFVFAKSTEGSYYTSPAYTAQASAADAAGLLHGAYHFANPRDSDGATQASFFVNNHGGWSGTSGRILPGVLDVEYDPYSLHGCYGLNPSQMVSWIAAFDARYVALTGVHPIIYTTTNWWSTCTGNSTRFRASNPLWLARWATDPGALPAGMTSWAFWQSGTSDAAAVDYNAFHGTFEQLQQFAKDPHSPYAMRLFGGDRTVTSVAASRRQFIGRFASGTGVVYLARRDELADAMAAGTLTDGPILLVPSCAGIPDAVTAEIARLAPSRVIALGGTGAICQASLDQGAAGRSQSRLWGPSRIETATAIAARRATLGPISKVYLASAASTAPDALAGGQLTAGPILLVPSRGAAPAQVTSAIATLNPASVVALGGLAAVSDQTLASAAGSRATDRISGPDRYATSAAIATAAFPATATVAYLASGTAFADAVSSGQLGDGMVLFVPSCGALPPTVAATLGRARPQAVVPLGGPSVVCDAVTKAARAAASG